MSSTINLGILGASSIAQKAILAAAPHTDRVTVTGIAARDAERAQQYARKHAIATAYPDYASLLADPDIDGCYVGLINSLHVPWAEAAMQAGKPVLVEKPLALNSEALLTLQHVSRETGTPVVEALMVQHHPWQTCVKDLIEQHTYGPLQRIETRIGFTLDPQERPNDYRLNPTLGGGVWNDLGCYWLQFLQHCLSFDSIDSFTGKKQLDEQTGIDRQFEAHVQYQNGVQAHCECSFDSPYVSDHHLFFANASIRIKNFFRPSIGAIKMNLNVLKNDGQRDTLSFEPQGYYINQLNHFADVVQEHHNARQQASDLSLLIERTQRQEQWFQQAEVSL